MKNYSLLLIILSFLMIGSTSYSQKKEYNIKYYNLIPESKIGEEGGSFFSYPSDIFIDAQGNTCITDIKDMCIKIFDKKGKLLKKLGQKGKGPGDFGWIQFAQNDNKNNLVVFDFLEHRLTVYDKNYKFVKIIKINESFENIVSLNTGNYFAITKGMHSKTTQMTKYYLKLYDKDLKAVRTIDSLEIYTFYEDKEGGFVYEYFDSYFLKKLNNGNILLATANDYMFRIYSSAGKQIFKGKNAYTPIRVTQKEKDVFFEGKKYFGEKEKNIVGEIRNKPGIAAIFTDKADRLFIKTHENLNNAILFDVFNSNGKFLYKVGLPNKYSYKMCCFNNDYLYSIILGDANIPPSVVKYKMITPSRNETDKFQSINISKEKK